MDQLFSKQDTFQANPCFFKQEFEGKVRVGINENGVHIIDPKALKVVSLRFEQILSWNSEKKEILVLLSKRRQFIPRSITQKISIYFVCFETTAPVLPIRCSSI